MVNLHLGQQTGCKMPLDGFRRKSEQARRFLDADFGSRVTVHSMPPIAVHVFSEPLFSQYHDPAVRSQRQSVTGGFEVRDGVLDPFCVRGVWMPDMTGALFVTIRLPPLFT